MPAVDGCPGPVCLHPALNPQRQGTRLGMAITVFAFVVAAYLILVGSLYVFQRSLLYLPSSRLGDPAASGVPEMSAVKLRTADGLELVSWYRRADPGRPTMVYFHGNGGNIAYRVFRIRPYLEAGLGLLLVEYRGYGGNSARPDEEGLYADGRAAMAFLAADGVPTDEVVMYGESLGGGVVIHIAAELGRAKTSVGAIVLEAPLSSVTDVAAYHYPFVPVRWLLKDRFESAEKIGHVAAPVLIIHGENDRIVPARFGRLLFNAAREPKESRWIAEGGHEDLHLFGLQPSVLEYITRHLAPPEQQRGT